MSGADTSMHINCRPNSLFGIEQAARITKEKIMAGFTLNEWIDEMPQTVFSSLMDEQLAPQIMHNVKSMKKITDGDVQIGTQFREIRIVNGKEQTTDLEVIAYKAPSKYGVMASQSGIDVSYYYSLTPQNGGTQVDLECVVSTKGLKKLMLPVVAGVMKKEDGNHLLQIKQFLERNYDNKMLNNK